MEHEVNVYDNLTEEQRRIVLEMRKYPNSDDYTDEELDKIRAIDSGNKTATYESSKLDKIITKEQYEIAREYLKSNKEYLDNLKLDTEILRLKTAIAWLETRKPRFKSIAYGKAHAKYINYRRALNLHLAIQEKNLKGKIIDNVGEWV